MADGTVTQTFFRPNKKQFVAKFQWLAAATSGSLSAATTNDSITDIIRGMYCVLGITNPGGTTAPTDNYDIAVNDSFGCDIFGSELNNRDTATVEQAMPKIGNTYGPRPITTALSIALTGNSQASASGALYLVFEE